MRFTQFKIYLSIYLPVSIYKKCMCVSLLLSIVLVFRFLSIRSKGRKNCIHVSDCMCSFWVETNLCMFYFIVFYICTAVRYRIIKRGELGSHQLASHRNIYVSVPNQDLNFQCHASWPFLCWMIWVESNCFVFVILVELLTITV